MRRVVSRWISSDLRPCALAHNDAEKSVPAANTPWITRNTGEVEEMWSHRYFCALGLFGTFLAMLAAPVLFRKFGLVTGIVYTQIATAVALGCLATASGPLAATTIHMGYVAFQWMSEPGILSLLMNHVAPKEQAGASALNLLVINTSQAIAAAVAGFSFIQRGK